MFVLIICIKYLDAECRLFKLKDLSDSFFFLSLKKYVYYIKKYVRIYIHYTTLRNLILPCWIIWRTIYPNKLIDFLRCLSNSL